jgi:hypothetical protein
VELADWPHRSLQREDREAAGQRSLQGQPLVAGEMVDDVPEQDRLAELQRRQRAAPGDQEGDEPPMRRQSPMTRDWSARTAWRPASGGKRWRPRRALWPETVLWGAKLDQMVSRYA